MCDDMQYRGGSRLLKKRGFCCIGSAQSDNVTVIAPEDTLNDF